MHVANKAHTSFSDTRVTVRVIPVVQVNEVSNQQSLFSCFKSFVFRAFQWEFHMHDFIFQVTASHMQKEKNDACS